MKVISPYTDDTVLMWGEYKFIRISKIPAHYLLFLKENGKSHDKALLQYVEENKDRLEAIISGEMPPPKPAGTCLKISYSSEQAAKDEVRYWNSRKEGHRKLVREYWCKHCEGWHLTSKPKSTEHAPR